MPNNSNNYLEQTPIRLNIFRDVLYTSIRSASLCQNTLNLLTSYLCSTVSPELALSWEMAWPRPIFRRVTVLVSVGSVAA